MRQLGGPSLRQDDVENPVKSMTYGVFCFPTHKPTIKRRFLDLPRASQGLFGHPLRARLGDMWHWSSRSGAVPPDLPIQLALSTEGRCCLPHLFHCPE
ncbi:hypothetical protein BCEP4_1080042 [Burkholderia cepacia]|nr:hypothetical protein BCEP4_1080042 [Burkholderia cepacia]